MQSIEVRDRSSISLEDNKTGSIGIEITGKDFYELIPYVCFPVLIPLNLTNTSNIREAHIRSRCNILSAEPKELREE